MSVKTWEVLVNETDPASSVIISDGEDDLLEVFHRGRATVSRTQVEAIEIANRIVATRDDSWQPIETAPKDGNEILIVVAGIGNPARVGFWDAAFDPGVWSKWPGREPMRPTHWKPLPIAPETTGAS